MRATPQARTTAAGVQTRSRERRPATAAKGSGDERQAQRHRPVGLQAADHEHRGYLGEHGGSHRLEPEPRRGGDGEAGRPCPSPSPTAVAGSRLCRP
ncbi:MAG TPA: hypothetical protein VM388_09955 [Acidimicrobiales bacterium]|nr:hypothetical protein [Acidimicrobiales bacterium]